MAAAISALNAKIRSQPVLNYLCSTRKLHPLNLVARVLYSFPAMFILHNGVFECGQRLR